MKDKNPEELHEVATNLNKEQISGPAFVNPGTPDKPLVGMKDLPDPVASQEGSKMLRDNLIK